MANITVEAFMSKLSVALGVDYSEEQIEFAKNMTKPQICFASPGTGKTATAVAALFATELFHRIPGDTIYALSFTNAATAELKIRYLSAAEKLKLRTTNVQFMTLHSMCSKLLKDNADRLGMDRLSIGAPMTIESASNIIISSAEEWGCTVSRESIRPIVKAIRDLNSRLVFSQENVESSIAFKETGLDYFFFNKIRSLLFQYNLLVESVQVNDILLYTLYMLSENPDIEAYMKDKIKIMLVDEAQDLSLLQLRLICKLTANPILIGDLKQQIYAFNGACQEIVQRYLDVHPNADKYYLTRTYRCKTEITEYAAKLIAPNMTDENDVCTGTGTGGSVVVLNGLNLDKVTAKLYEEYIANRRLFYRETMFLFRNNASAIPIIESLYKHGLPFYVEKYTPAFELPVIKELCEILTLCKTPQAPTNARALRYLIPEFNVYRQDQPNPIEKIMHRTGQDAFSVNYQFRQGKVAADVMCMLCDVRESMQKGKTVAELINMLWPLFNENYLKGVSWKLEFPVEYYIRNVTPLVTNKTYDAFQLDEMGKLSKAEEYKNARRGIRCLTMHGAKGLEADDVYIIDADEGLIPNTSKLNRSIKKGSALDAAKEIRNERSLCYVAVTRARENVYIVYNKTPAALMIGDNPYTELDSLYANHKNNDADDIISFDLFCDAIREVV